MTAFANVDILLCPLHECHILYNTLFICFAETKQWLNTPMLVNNDCHYRRHSRADVRTFLLKAPAMARPQILTKTAADQK